MLSETKLSETHFTFAPFFLKSRVITRHLIVIGNGSGSGTSKANLGPPVQIAVN